MATTLRPTKTAMLVAQRIVGDIHDRGNVIGDRLPPERTMLERYDVGRGTLRESLRFLELQGVITLKPGPGGGPVVVQPDADALASSLTLLLQFSNAPFRTIAEARLGLEPMMAQLSADRMSEGSLASLKESVETMHANLSNQTIFLEENKRFHDLIAHGSGNAMFGFLVDALLGILDGSSIGIDYPEMRRKAVHKAHLQIYQTIEQRDPAAAADAMHEHIEAYMKYATKKYPEILDGPIVWGNH